MSFSTEATSGDRNYKNNSRSEKTPDGKVRGNMSSSVGECSVYHDTMPHICFFIDKFYAVLLNYEWDFILTVTTLFHTASPQISLVNDNWGK